MRLFPFLVENLDTVSLGLADRREAADKLLFGGECRFAARIRIVVEGLPIFAKLQVITTGRRVFKGHLDVSPRRFFTSGRSVDLAKSEKLSPVRSRYALILRFSLSVTLNFMMIYEFSSVNRTTPTPGNTIS